MDYVGCQNIISPSAGISVSPLRELDLLANYQITRHRDSDFVYAALQYTF
jgi:hypothetical protein